MAIQKTKEPSKVDAALQRFAEMLMKRMEEMQKDWHKGWIGGGSMFGLPQNISGRTYEGSNAFLLFLHTASNGYKAPVYMTYGQLHKEGAHVLKGEKAVPVFKWGFSIKDKDGKKVTEEEFNNMTDDEKKECKRRPFLKIYPEFNIDQTNMSEVNKEKYDAVVSQFRKTDVPTITDGMYVNKAIDRMMEKQEWVCKIQYDKEEKGAYYSPAKDIVVLPTKAQFRIHPDDPEECFKDGQEYYGTALHEMAHSTGHPSRLDRLKPAAFGSPEYAKEELVAELTSAMVGNTLGFDRRISDNNVAYLQNWTSALRKEPKFIVSVMADVNKASRIIIENIDKQRIALGEKPLVQGALDGVEEKVKNEQQFEEIKADQKKEDPREAIAKEWDSLAEKPTVEMESGDVLPVEYNKENDTLDVLITNEAGKQEVYSTNYDHDRSIEENVGHVWEELSNLKQYQAKEVKEETSSETAKDLGDGLSKEPEIDDKKDNSVPIEDGKGGLTPKEYFSTLMATLNDGQHDDHTALGIKNISELRDYFKDNHNVSEWVANATDKEIIEAGADMLPNIRYNHKEGRTLYDMEAAYSNINAKYEDVSDDRTRQIAHRIDQAKSIITTYHTNIENARGENYLFDEESAHKIIPREEYAKSVTQEQTVEPTQEKMDEIYYFSHTYLQSTDSREELDNLVEKQDYDSLLYLTREYDQGDALLQSQTYKNAKKFPGDDILAEDDNYAVVYNNSLGGTYDLMRKVTKQDIIDNIERYGLESDASDDVKKVAYENVAKQFSDIKSKIPAFTMPNGEKLDFHYNQDTNNIVVEKTMDNGEKKDVYQHPYNHELTTAENMSDIYAVISQKPEYQKAEEKENVVAHEDSNVQTNVEGLAEDIAETGVPMEQAEKEAKTIVDDKQHEDFHEEEDKKQDQAKAEKEQAEKEKQQQESKKDEDKPSKGVVHAAILLGALAAAKANDGVWMNKESKSNAEFIFSHTPVTAYNNIMMNLQSDQKGYRTNVFTSFNNAQKNGVAVKQGEKATPFNWTQWDYQNLTDKNDIISNKEYEKLSDEEKKMYGKHASRLTQYIYNIDQTTYPAVGGDQFVTLLKEKGAQQESLKPSTSASFLKQFDEIKAKHPDVIVIMRKDDSYEIYKSDAKKAAEATHLPVTKQEIEGKKIDTVSFSHTMLDVHLPNIIRAGHRVAVCDQLEDPKLVKSVPEGKAVLDRAYSTAKAVAKQEGIKYERVMVIQDAKYDKTDDKIEVSGMIDKSVGSERLAALQKANDIYRAVVAATGTENRLDRSGRNSLLPEDDAKHEKLVQELAAGVLMARQGLPATLSKESQKLIPYWERELKENPKMVGVIERDVNNAVETIDNLIAKRKVDYKAIRGQLPPKMITDKAENYSLAADLAKLPSIDTKEVVVIRDRKANKVDVILPAGASVEANNEVPGMRKDRISIALKKEGFNEVKFYNAGGSLGLNKPNTYFEGKDVSLNQLKQYQLVNYKTIEVAQQPKQENKVEIEHFRAIKDDYGRWAFYIKPKNEPQFSVYPPKEHMNKYFSVRNTPDEKTTRAALANKWYEVAKQFPDVRVDIINPHPAKDIDMSRIVNPTITKSAQDPKVKIVFATIDGERHHATVNETQWQRMWLADNMAEYKKAVAAVVFEPVLRKGMESQQTQSEVVKETEKVEVKEAPEPEPKQEEQEKQSTSRGLHM
ncbi:ArdC-like ssDNA-binding domain-containing protein [Bacteroides stercoris]|uniref:ArdC-like ssDNA-binding domain-containing protein n=1 Tax=Bacteroides stercoris TaxID=46506 RepID=UPI00232CA765|nr:ArdC-like ssDNA-binding domain-containing protein [Bacteroides stercoris]MDC2283465.1 ArdC-like ssDNA-binding domain-containing protein [Bacteroides stercoris]MDC2297109.1 ArdC-like ssDNA-binding domain-containing protein [Bacteroides stercoris]